MADTNTKRRAWRRFARAGVAVALGVLIWSQAEQHVSSPATAAWQDAEEDAYFGHEAMALGDLDDLRGGFNIGDYIAFFGVEISSMVAGVDGVAAFFQRINIIGSDASFGDPTATLTTPNGTQGGLGMTIGDLSDETYDSSTVTIVTGAEAINPIPAGSDLSALQGASGIVLTDPNGTTALLSEIGNGAIQNALVNIANGRTASQSLHISVTPTSEFMANIALDQLRNQLSSIHREIGAQFRN